MARYKKQKSTIYAESYSRFLKQEERLIDAIDKSREQEVPNHKIRSYSRKRDGNITKNTRRPK